MMQCYCTARGQIAGDLSDPDDLSRVIASKRRTETASSGSVTARLTGRPYTELCECSRLQLLRVTPPNFREPYNFGSNQPYTLGLVDLKRPADIMIARKGLNSRKTVSVTLRQYGSGCALMSTRPRFGPLGTQQDTNLAFSFW